MAALAGLALAGTCMSALFNFRRSAMVDFYLPESSCENIKKRLLGLTELPVVGNWCAERPSESMLFAVGLGAWPGIRPNVRWKTSPDVTVDGTVERTGEGHDLGAAVSTGRTSEHSPRWDSNLSRAAS